MKCENCGANMRADRRTKFCPYCGATIRQPDTVVDLEEVRANHAENMRVLEYQRKEKEDKNSNKLILGIFAGVILLLAIGFAIAFIPKANENNSLQKQVEKVQQLIVSGDYDAALVEAQTIRVEKRGLFDDHYSKWENQRKDLIRLIEQKKKESGQ